MLRMSISETVITLPPRAERTTMLGASERNLKMLREALGVNIAARDRTVRITGDGASESSLPSTGS